MKPLLTEAHSPSLNGRIPYRMQVDAAGTLFFRWLYVGEKPFAEPFFDETLGRCWSLPQNSESPLPVTSAATLIERAALTDAVAPSAFIYHISRCGSTLLSQMLAMDERFIVLSEVPLLDEVLRLPFRKGLKEVPPLRDLFCALLHLLGTKRSGKETQLFVKTDSWHILFHEQLQHWFPQTPALLLYRSPGEVIRSQQGQWGMHAVPGLIEAEIFGFDPEEVLLLKNETYLRRVLLVYFRKYLDVLETHPRAKAVSYHSGAIQLLHALTELCGISIQEELLQAMRARTQFHSKNPLNRFTASTPGTTTSVAEFLKQLEKEETKKLTAERP